MVASEYWLGLLALGAVSLTIRIAHRGPLLPRLAHTLDGARLVLVLIVLLALAFHCVAMFFPGAVDVVPGLDTLAEPLADLGLASQLAYWIPAGVLVLALAPVWWPSRAALVLALAAVGITMFWDFGLSVHLAAISGAVTILVGLGVALVGRTRASAESSSRLASRQ